MADVTPARVERDRARRFEGEPPLDAVFEPESPFDPSPEVLVLRHRAAMSRALASTATMRNAREQFLPAFPMEDPDDYDLRLSRSFLLEDYAESLVDHANRAIHEGFTVDGSVPDDVKAWLNDIDGRGASLNEWAAESLWIALRDGGVWTWVDQQQVGAGTTEGQARAAGIRPRAMVVDVDSMLGWISEDTETGSEITQVRIETSRSERLGTYGRQVIREAWVLDVTLGQVEKWERTETDDTARMADGFPIAADFADGVPVLHFAAGPAEGVWLHRPPFLAHAWKNIEHWQSSSEQRHALAYVRRWFYHFKGFSPEEFEEMVSIGSNVKIRSDKETAAIEVAGAPTDGVVQGFTDLGNLQADMRRLGRRPLSTDRPGDVTATEVVLQDARSSPTLVTTATRFESHANRTLETMAAFRGIAERLPAKSLTLPKEQLATSGISDLEVMDRLGMDRAVILEEAQRRDTLDDKWTLEDVWPETDEPPEPEPPPVPAPDEQDDETSENGEDN